jgi:hypothetical protein
MFERSKVDNSPEPSAVPCEVTFVDGEVVKGKLMVPASRTLADVLNGSGAFVEFEPYGGDRRWIAKGQVGALKPVGIPRVPNLKAKARALDDFDPHMILGVAPDTPWEEVRAAYVRLSKIYHPDRYANAELPAEVRDYLAAMARRINAAHEAVQAPRQTAKRNGSERSTPIYTSPPRG